MFDSNQSQFILPEQEIYLQQQQQQMEEVILSEDFYLNLSTDAARSL
jgi:hypothetical protein